MIHICLPKKALVVLIRCFNSTQQHVVCESTYSYECVKHGMHETSKKATQSWTTGGRFPDLY